MKLKIGTRGSKLALFQANLVKDKLLKIDPSLELEIVTIKTSGDKITDKNLYECGGKGLFLKEIEEALLNKEIDIAVHSTKDVPGFLPEGLIIDCFLEREDPRDVFISSKYNSIDDLPNGAVVGSCAPRRIGQLKQIRPDLKFVTFRGNVPTRLEKAKNEEVDATILAFSGMKRLGLESEIKVVLSTDVMLPAVGQGAICVEQRETDKEISKLLAKINHEYTHTTVSMEREFLKSVDGNCTTPLAALAASSDEIFLWLANDDHSKFSYQRTDAKSISFVAEMMKKSVDFKKI